MKEQLTNNNDRHELHSKHEFEKKHLPDIDKLHQEMLSQSNEKLKTEELKSSALEHAKRVDEISIDQNPAAEKQEYKIYATLKSETYKQTLSRIQSQLSRPDRTLSKAMHNKTVERVSDTVGKTAARPSGILGGGIVSLLGSSLLLYMSKKYGFEYNFAMFFALIIIGFSLGLVIEFFVLTLKKARK